VHHVLNLFEAFMLTKSSAESSLLSPRSSTSQQHHCYRNSAASFIIFIVYHLRYLRFTSHSKVRIQGSPARTQWANPNKTFFGAVSLEKHFIL
jgi:hypothetical protein